MADIREVSTLPLACSVIDALLRNGFRVVSDLKNIQPLDLSQEIGVPADVALNIIQCAENSFLTVSLDKIQVSAKDLLLKYGIGRPIITFCKSFDTILGGGVPIGQITEFCGVPGVGKTQLATQLALNVQIPELFNGCGGEAVYIDTEGSFMVERVAEMATEISTHLQKLVKANASKMKDSQMNLVAAAENMSMERFLEGIHMYRVHDQTELIATINSLSSYLKLKTKIKLIVIDSIAFHFRQDLMDTVSRNRVLSALAQQLNQFAFEHHLAVVLVNHVTTRLDRAPVPPGEAAGSVVPMSMTGSAAAPGMGESTQRLVPALGEHWSHCITNRVIMHWTSGRTRRATLVKSPTFPNSYADYCICHRGIRDIHQEGGGGERKRKADDV